MSGSRVLARAVSAVAAASALLVLPVAPTSYAAPERCSASQALACDTDTDGDGLPDSGDGCPTTASSNPTGCPTAARRAKLRWVRSDQRLEARITSPVTACAARARIVLWRVRPRRDYKIVAATAAYSGKRRFTVPRGAYYVSVSPSYSSGVAECAKATSTTVQGPPP